MRTLPILLLFGAMFYWMWRIRRFRLWPTSAYDHGGVSQAGIKSAS